MFGGLAVGVAAVWLLGGYLRGKPGPLVFLGMLFILTGFGAMTFAATADWGEFGLQFAMFVVLGVAALVMALSLRLAGWFCRRQLRALKLSLWLLACLAAIWLLVVTPFAVITAAVSDGVEWWSMLGGALAFAGASFAVILPFLILAFANAFYRERLKGLLGLAAPSTPPPVIPVTRAASAA